MVLFVTVGIFAVFKFLGLLRRAAQGHLPIDGLDVILGLKLMTFLDAILAPAVFIAILMVLLRWNRDNEITIFAASGIGPLGYFIPAIVIALAMLIIGGALSLWVSPLADRIYTFELEKYRQSLKATPFREGQFRVANNGKDVFYLSNTPQDEVDPLRIFLLASSSEQHEIMVAKNASFEIDPATQAASIELRDGIRYKLQADSGNYEETQFQSLIDVVPFQTNIIALMPEKAKSTIELMQSNSKIDFLELQWRLSRAVTIFVLVLLAFALGSRKFSARSGVNIIGALAIYFGYAIMLGFLNNLSKTNLNDSWVLIWIIHLSLLGIVVWVNLRTHYHKPLVPAFFPLWR